MSMNLLTCDRRVMKFSSHYASATLAVLGHGLRSERPKLLETKVKTAHTPGAKSVDGFSAP